MGDVEYCVEANGTGWRVVSRGFAWQFASWRRALGFALATARAFAESTGRATAVRMLREDGGRRDLRSFAGITRLPPPERVFPQPVARAR